MRCLKRRLCRIVYNRLRTDYARRQQFVATAVEPVTDVKSSVPAWMQSADLAVSLEVEDINGSGGASACRDESRRQHPKNRQNQLDRGPSVQVCRVNRRYAPRAIDATHRCW